jgi:hypothetical protein
MSTKYLLLIALSCLLSCSCRGQEQPYYSRLNTFSTYIEYSNTSSHIEWGVSRRRKLAAAGGSYARRFNAPHWFDWTPQASVFYEIEFDPLVLLQDQIATDVYGHGANSTTVSTPTDELCVTGNYYNYQGVPFVRAKCGTRWTFMGSASPVGFRVNFMPKHKLQPFIDSHLGAFLAPHNEPVDNSSSFNFTFKFGAGLELYQNSGRSFAVEYRLQHFSNAYISSINPGVDSQLVKVTYSFGSKFLR